MKFTKMNGAGNDFIIIDNRNGIIHESTYNELAKILCKRCFSIGADGMIVIENSDDPQEDFKIRFVNCNGTFAEMCGNGVRCICRYAFDNGLSGNLQHIETDSGIVTGEKIDEDNYRIRMNGVSKIDLEKRLSIKGTIYNCAYIEFGTPGLPHLVINMPGLSEMAENTLLELGLALVHCPDLEKGANVNFYDIPNASRPSDVIIRTCERFVDGFTFACGSGASSTALVLRLLGCESETYRLFSRGGLLIVELVQSENISGYDIYLTGPVYTVAEGDILDISAIRLISRKHV